MSEAIKHAIRRRWPREVRAAFQDYYPGEAVLADLERKTSGPAQMAMILRLAAIAHAHAYPQDAAHPARMH
jgi:hypothetical protein